MISLVNYFFGGQTEVFADTHRQLTYQSPFSFCEKSPPTDHGRSARDLASRAEEPFTDFAGTNVGVRDNTP